MGFFNGSNAHFYPNKGFEYYNDVKRKELEENYSNIQNISWYHVVLEVSAVALFILFFMIFG